SNRGLREASSMHFPVLRALSVLDLSGIPVVGITILVAVLAVGAPNIAIKAHFLLFAFPELHGRTIRL
ncbi:MAG TPA: hypothetical protein VJ884_00020, partial [Salinibacter sp.]|nr:hypothetical protein [Salinibacter sp.]